VVKYNRYSTIVAKIIDKDGDVVFNSVEIDIDNSACHRISLSQSVELQTD
jgi:hypothetical protein